MQRILGYRFRRTTVQLIGFLSFLAGVGLVKAGWHINWLICWMSLALLLLSVRRRTIFTLTLICLCSLSLGLWRGGIYAVKEAQYKVHWYEPVSMTAVATNDAVYGKSSQITFDVHNVVLDDGEKLVGKTAVSGFGTNAVYEGDIVQIDGKLYKGFGARQGSISFARITLLQRHPSAISVLRRKFTAGAQSVLPEPLAPFAMGILVGQRATLPDDVKQNLLEVGLTHIIAVSGYNLTIMLQASRRLLGKRSKRMSTILTLALIAVFLLIAGLSASIVRAAIVSLLSIAAAYYGRSFKPLNLLALAAVITVWANPFYLWSDLSWYLSFLAFFGVMVISPLLMSRLPPGWHESAIIGVAIESIAAEIASLPFVLYIFGQMSLVSLPANMLITTLVPLAMLLGLFAGLAGMFCSAVAGWITWPAVILLNYMLDTAAVLAHLPHVFREHIGFPLPVLIGCYLFTLTMVWLLGRKTNKAKAAIITEKKQVRWTGVGFERTQQMVND